MKQILAIVFTFTLLGCMAQAMKERSPEYDQGFGDGCNNASSQGLGVPREPKRNEMLYAKDADYRMGWNSGNTQCRMELPNHL